MTKNIDQKFDYKALMSCISNTLKREEETLGNYLKKK
jgi:hypothetical protein